MWIISFNKYCLHSLAKFHGWVLVTVNWYQEKSLFKGRWNWETIKKQKGSKHNWMKLMRFYGQWYVARHNRKLNESLLQASHDIFSTIKRNIYLFFFYKRVYYVMNFAVTLYHFFPSVCLFWSPKYSEAFLKIKKTQTPSLKKPNLMLYLLFFHFATR